MSFRYYPMYLRGNPQLRVYLPNFWMKLIPSEKPDVPYKVTFKTPVEMTDWDIKNYLEKIYKIPVKQVASRVMCGPIKPAPGKSYLIKASDDYRLANVWLPEDQSFTFPNIFPEVKTKEAADEELAYKKSMEREVIVKRHENRDRHTVPSWFRM